VVAVALALTINSYGYFRDEMYFRILAGHPAWGYVDQPPLTPMVAKVSIALFGDHLWAIRVVPLVTTVAAVVPKHRLTPNLGWLTERYPSFGALVRSGVTGRIFEWDPDQRRYLDIGPAPSDIDDGPA
jgi:hypothetical protein